jgi:hypothetical protein
MLVYRDARDQAAVQRRLSNVVAESLAEKEQRHAEEE